MSNDHSEGGDVPAGIRPIVSVIMANHNGAAYLGEAIASVLAQTLDAIELIIADDASTDDSLAIVRSLMATDPRIRLVAAQSNGGPARTRNRALDLARGDWIAIVDADDVIAPHRLARLVGAGEARGVDIVADDLLYFVDGAEPHARLLQDAILAGPEQVTPEGFIAGKSQAGGAVAFGYLKPLIRRSALAGLRYDETLRIGEDYDLLLRLLLGGAELCVLPEPMYHYRRHSRSVSHRLSVATVRAMIESQDRFVAGHGPFPARLALAFGQRRDALARRLDYEELVDDLKGRRLGAAFGALLSQPSLLLKLARSLNERLTRRLSPSRKVAG
jgi:succinoglycan biosynthesis protein ExoO